MGGMYRSARLLVHEPPATRWYHQNRLSAIDFDSWRSIEGEKGKKKKKKRKRRTRGEEERRRGEEERRPPFPVPSSLVGDSSPVRGDRTSPRTGRKIEATPLVSFFF
ncbi:hypothetical protein BHM03_00003451 [Ensete ventricosum]|nr:hypothetical protein BHM03_00003451 [Ensete ventricosum]